MEEEVFIPGEPVLATKKATREAVDTGGFTPGPWFMTPCDDGILICAPDNGDVDDPWNVALAYAGCGYPDDPRTGTTEHNARLIAAAPELYEAAKAVFDGLNERIDAAAREGKPVPVFAGIAALSDALNKALGHDRPEGSAQSAPEGPGRTT